VSFDRYYSARSIGHQPFRSACYAPFVGLSFDMHGFVSVCAASRTTPLGRVGELRLDEMWHGPVAERMRAAVRADDLGLACTRCAEEIAGGNVHGVVARGFDQFTAQEDTPWPSRMEFALSTACNLQCEMCSGEFSSAIRAHREGLPPYPSRYGDKFLEELEPFLLHLQQARFLGGEPFLAEINFRIWERMVRVGSPAECNVTTNGTVWTPRMEAVLDRIPFSIGISIDGVTAATVERVRRGADHGRIMANLERFIAYRDRHGTSLSLTFCLMVDNWQEFGDYLVFAEERGCQVFVNTVRQPPRHSLYRLPTAELERIVQRLDQDRDAYAARLEVNRDAWLEQIERLRDHLEHRRGGTTGTLEGHLDPRFDELAAQLAAAASEDEAVERLRHASEDGEVSIVRADADDNVVVAGRYLGVDVEHLVGRPAATLSFLAPSLFGHRVDVLAQHVEPGSPARILTYDEPGATPTVVAMVTRRGPVPYATTRLVAILQHGRRGASTVPVALSAARS